MQCDEFELRLNEALDERRRPEDDPALAGHAAACRACGEVLAAQRRLWQMLGAAAPPLSSDFADRAAAAAAADWHAALPARSWGRTIQGVATTLATLSAVLALALATTWHVSRQIESQPGGPDMAMRSAQEREARSIEEGLLQPEPSKRPLPWILDWERLPSSLALTDPEGRPTAGVATIQRFAGGLRPVATSLSTAWQILRDKLPHFLGGEDDDVLPETQATA